MRLTAYCMPITAFRNLTKPYYLSLLTPLVRQYSNGRALHTCACQCSKWKNNLQTANLNYFKSIDRFHSAAYLPILRRHFSDTIPAPTTIQQDSSSTTGKENDSKSRRRTLDQVVYHLQADLRRKRRIHRAEIHNAIELIEEASNVEDFGTFLLNCCCDILPDLQPSYRVKLAERIWAVIQKSQAYSSAHFESMLKVLAINEDNSLDPFTFLEEAKSVGVKASGTMYYFAILRVCQRGDLEAAVKVLNMMKDDMVPVNERFFNALMLGNLRAGDFKGATDLLSIMRANQINPSIHTWTTLLSLHIEMGNLEELRKTHAEIQDSQLNEDQFYDLLKAAGRQTNSNILDLVIRWAKESRKMDTSSLINVAAQLLHLGHPDSALKIVLQFADVLRKKREPLGTFFIKEVSVTNAVTDPETYINLVSSLQGESRNPYALNIAAEYCLKQKKFDLAFEVFRTMLSMNVPVRPHYFLPALIAETQDNGTLGGMKVLKEMKSLNVQPDWEMLIDWIIPMLLREEENLLEVLKIVQGTTGLSYSSDGLLSAGLIVALNEGKIEEGIKVLEKLKAKVFYPERVMESLLLYICGLEENDTKDLASVMKYLKYVSLNKPLPDRQDYAGAFVIKLLEVDRCEEAELLVAEIAKSPIPVSESAAVTLKERLKLKEELEVDKDLIYDQYNNKHVTNVKEMDLTALECHKEELESKEMNARGVTRKLFLKYCASENIENVLQHKLRFEKDFGEISRGMKSALMGAYVRNGVLQPALQLFRELTEVTEEVSDVVIDVYKIIDLATLMVKNGMVEDAIALIHEKCPSRRVQRPESITRNIVRLLEAVSNSDSDYVYDLTQLFLKLRFIKPTNPALAPSIKDLVKRNDVEGAVQRLEHYSKKYKISPCVQELTYSVLDKPELLERVYKCSVLTKGEQVAKRLQALARADMGDIDGAAKDFVELGNDLNFASILRQCEYLSSKNETVKVLNMIKALVKTGLNYDFGQLYDIAIQGCQRSGNKEGLKEILSNMEDQDLYISPKLKQLLVKSI